MFEITCQTTEINNLGVKTKCYIFLQQKSMTVFLCCPDVEDFFSVQIVAKLKIRKIEIIRIRHSYNLHNKTTTEWGESI